MPVNIPKHALILAAGVGSRLRPLTELSPKPLVQIHGTPILHNALHNLGCLGVEHVTIVVGYRKEAIQDACGSRFGSVTINYVESSVYDRTGSACSLWLARDALLSGDYFVLEGDVFFEENVLRQLIITEATNAAAVAPFHELMQGSAVLLSDLGFISEFRLKQTARDLIAGGPPLYKTMNLLRLSASTLRTEVIPALDDMIRAGATQAYTEELLSYLVETRGLLLAAVRCDGLRWYEIDDAEDLRTAERIFAEADHV
ncbi:MULTISPECIES: phosphocholine cytidylyltransferase family protein [unclassified Bradyrhizobium]|uniref:phosphocholine cytidylyltransferase family protein n=1 Tax=unclassified Bradyrhizobium TaxID=2631580 RepID=UPI001CD20159|nr:MULTISPECIES: phosphocholine cytidylyltransferase family protein [unclassified Bradyrhizobium]MCA1378999.1 phosphocholine cytidylyltransferase family protein [Bradyrhizobium sp. IC4060]MCA1488959.1 phosphocholine cytidylyltransferase family protein [Bradyrhizobium sp. IC4061]